MFEELDNGIKRLVALYEGQKAENDRLRSQMDELREINCTKEKQIADLKKDIERLKLRSAFTGSSLDGNARAREKVDKLIREIDRCICAVGE